MSPRALPLLLTSAVLITSLQGRAQHAAAAPSLPQLVAVEQGSVATLRVTSRIVLLDVVVTDRKGNPVDRLLTRDNFTVIEDRQVQQIRSFEPPIAHRMPPGNAAIVNSAADLKKIGDAPVTILVLDELNSRFEDMSYARAMMIKYLQSQPPVLKQPTVVMIAQNNTFQQMHDYTQDRDALIGIIKKHMPEYPWRMMNGGRSGPAAVERMAQVLAALQQIAQASAGTSGRKNLIWVGNGFPSADLVGLDHTQADLIESAMRSLTTRLLAMRITMYTINPAPGTSSTLDIETPDDLDAALNDNGTDPFGGGTVSFSNLAPSTGGIAYTGRNDLNNIIGEGIDQGQNYYTFSYSPTNTSENPVQFRNVKVVMKDPTLRATTRDGYYPETTAELNPVLDKTMSAKQVAAYLKMDISSALLTTIAYNGLDVTAQKSSGGTYAIHVAEDGIAWSGYGAGGAQHAEATIAAAWYDAKGKLLGHVAREETYLRPANSAGASFSLPVTLPGNCAKLRFVVRDALNGRMGTVDLASF
jgi:VWFA-related protein